MFLLIKRNASVGPTFTPLPTNSIGRAGSLGRIIELRGYHSGSKITFTKLLLLVGLVAYAAYALKVI